MPWLLCQMLTPSVIWNFWASLALSCVCQINNNPYFCLCWALYFINHFSRNKNSIDNYFFFLLWIVFRLRIPSSVSKWNVLICWLVIIETTEKLFAKWEVVFIYSSWMIVSLSNILVLKSRKKGGKKETFIVKPLLGFFWKNLCKKFLRGNVWKSQYTIIFLVL